MRTRAVPRWENMRLGCSQVGKYETGAVPRWENMQYRVYEGLRTSTFSLGCGKVHKPQVIVKLHGGCCRSYGQNRFGTYDPLQPKKRP